MPAFTLTRFQTLVDALQAYFADQLESALILCAAALAFVEWDNPC